MMPSKQINYFRIGSFVMLGIFLIIFAIILLSSGRLFKKTITVETYFSESIQGLSDGSPVKYRGVEIGHIDKISFVHQIYKPNNLQAQDAYSRYVYVEVIITPNVFTKSIKMPIKDIIQHDVDQGLRIKLALQGLTGNAYLELNFVDPTINTPLHIDWKPKNYYIPSAPSTLTKFSDNAQIVLEKLKKVHFQKIGNNTIELMQRINYLLSQTEQQLQNSIYNSAIITENLRAFSGKMKHSPSQILFGKAPPRLDPGKL